MITSRTAIVNRVISAGGTQIVYYKAEEATELHPIATEVRKCPLQNGDEINVYYGDLRILGIYGQACIECMAGPMKESACKACFPEGTAPLTPTPSSPEVW